MRLEPTQLKDVYLLKTEKRGDSRGVFARLFCEDVLIEAGVEFRVRQANFSNTRHKGSLRGLHFQFPPKAEDKIVRCTQGRVFDVIVDLRPDSQTYMQWQGFELTGESLDSLLVPKGFAHGFQTLEDDVEMHYLHSEFYAPEFESGVHFADPAVGIDWPLAVSDISDKDLKRPPLSSDFTGIIL